MQLIRAAVDFAAEHDEICFAMMDCAPCTLGGYRRLGFRRYGKAFHYASDQARSLPMCLVVADLLYLESLRSPIYGMLRDKGREHRSEASAFFQVHCCVDERGPKRLWSHGAAAAPPHQGIGQSAGVPRDGLQVRQDRRVEMATSQRSRATHPVARRSGWLAGGTGERRGVGVWRAQDTIPGHSGVAKAHMQ